MPEVKSVSDIIESISEHYKKHRGPESSHRLIYDSSTETLEPIYFYILDLMTTMGLVPKKYIDNFSSTPGSGHFAELGQRATIMQQQAAKIMGDVNTVLRSVLNLLYDLKEFKIRLQHYGGLTSKNNDEKEAAKLALKQVWMDKVDIAKGNSSIKAMALGQTGFQTLIDAFLAADSAKDANKIDLNDRVKRIVKSRLIEFDLWLNESEKELRKRYELERTYLKSQVNSLKLYARWVRPYLMAAQSLESKDLDREPALVKTFNTIILELTILGKSKMDISDEALKGNLPKEFREEKFLKGRRNYYSCIMVDFVFRGIPQKVSQQSHFAFGGRAEVTFKSYVLNEDELAKFEEAFKQSETDDVLSLIEGATTQSLAELQDEINSFLEEKPKEEKKKKMSLKEMFEPFTALFGAYNEKSEKKEEKPKKVIVRPEDYIEENLIRPLAADAAKDKVFDIFDIYKKAHGMASFT
jgi:hypothetical protein